MLLPSELARFKSDLDRAEADRQETMGREIADRREHIGNLKGDTRNMINDFETARKEMWRSLKSELESFTAGLAQFKADLENGEKERLETVVREMKEKGEELKANLRNFSSNLSASVTQMLGELNKDRSEAARAWHEILSAVRSTAGAMTLTTPEKAAPEPEREVKVVEDKKIEEAPAEATEDVIEPRDEASSETDAEEKEAEVTSEESSQTDGAEINLQTSHSDIVAILKDAPDGLRMVEIAEKLGVENWRSLISVMRELLDDGEVKKEDLTYFAI